MPVRSIQPHHVPLQWSAKYKGKFDDGWDALRERTLARQKELGVIPEDAELTARPEEIPAWDEIPDELKPALVDGLEEHRLVRRSPHPSDRRATLVSLSSSGTRTCVRLASGYGRLADELLAGTTDRQLAAGLAVIRRLDRGLDARRV